MLQYGIQQHLFKYDFWKKNLVMKLKLNRKGGERHASNGLINAFSDGRENRVENLLKPLNVFSN